MLRAPSPVLAERGPVLQHGVREARVEASQRRVHPGRPHRRLRRARRFCSLCTACPPAPLYGPRPLAKRPRRFPPRPGRARIHQRPTPLCLASPTRPASSRPRPPRVGQAPSLLYVCLGVSRAETVTLCSEPRQYHRPDGLSNDRTCPGPANARPRCAEPLLASRPPAAPASPTCSRPSPPSCCCCCFCSPS